MLVKAIIVASLCAVVVLSVPRAKRQLLGDFDVNEVKTALNNKNTVDALVKCMMASDADAATLCSKRGKLFRGKILKGYSYVGWPAPSLDVVKSNDTRVFADLTPKLIKKADCPSACTDQEKQVLAYAYKKLKTDNPDKYQALKTFYKDFTPDEWTKFEGWLDSVPSV